VIVLILVVGQNAVDSLPNHGQQWLLDERGVSSVFKGISELFSEPDPFIKLTNGEETGIRRQGRGRKFDFDRP
jgi:hypothetical protein